MSTLVCFHAHPDDESSQTGGLIAAAAEAGHRVVVVTATDGAEGEVHVELNEGETLAQRRRQELTDALAVLGAEPPVMLGYPDSGMMGDPANDRPDCFWQADVDEAAGRLAAILADLDADVLTVYDDHGGYGHPDHIQVHRVGLRAAELAGVDRVYETTMNRTRIQRLMDEMPAAEDDPERPDPAEIATLGTAEPDISYTTDVRRFADLKRTALKCHASQMPPDNFFMTMPDEIFRESFGYESFNLPGVADTGGPDMVDLLPGL